MVNPPPTVDAVRRALDSDVKIGVTSCESFPDLARIMEDRIAAGQSGGLGFTYASPETATDPSISFPWAKSIVVAAVPYLVDGDGGDDLDRTVARFADGDRYERVRQTLSVIVRLIDAAGYRTEAVYDDDRLVDRGVAIRSGVAWAGKSTMALTPGHGPWFLIGSVVTDAVMTATPAMVRTCGSCDACLPACPTGAIVAPGVLDASRCLAAILQRPGDVPRQFRGLVGSRVYGCDDCLVACPPGDQALDGVQVGFPTPAPAAVLGMTDDAINRYAAHWYVPKRSMRFVRRNALVALGNTAGPDDVVILTGYLGHPDPLLRLHAAWALGETGGPIAVASLAAALLSEEDASVSAEIERALAPEPTHAVYAERHDQAETEYPESE